MCLFFLFVSSMRVSSQNEALICTLWFNKDRLFVNRITIIIIIIIAITFLRLQLLRMILLNHVVPLDPA